VNRQRAIGVTGNRGLKIAESFFLAVGIDQHLSASIMGPGGHPLERPRQFVRRSVRQATLAEIDDRRQILDRLGRLGQSLRLGQPILG
jgi:hypothetical protein